MRRAFGSRLAIWLGGAAIGLYGLISQAAETEPTPPKPAQPAAKQPEVSNPAVRPGADDPDSGDSEATPQSEVAAPKPEDIAKWIAELDSEFYLNRERASQRLAESGPAALEPLAQAADGDNLEVATRAVRAMFDISQSNNGRYTRPALERIKELKNRPVDRETAISILRGLREREAIAEVKRLGGVAEREYEVDGEVVIYILRLGQDWKGGDEGLSVVKDLKGLRMLQLHGAPLTDKCLSHVAEMPDLQRIEVYGKDYTLDAINALRKALPSADVQHRRGALLGIRGTPMGSGGAVVEFVQPESAAEAAGIIAGDIIVKYDGKPIDNFEQLTDQIGQCQPGDKATLELIRTNEQNVPERITKEVKFGSWR